MSIKLPWEGKRSETTPVLTREQVLASSKRKFGQSNPEIADDPFLEYMVRSRTPAWDIREQFNLDWDVCTSAAAQEAQAIWCFSRIGMTSTLYRGEYVISIVWEYDYSYDPDFLIYNDVVIRDLRGGVWIYRYPRSVLPPTDFHTATLIDEPTQPGDGILIIGGIGYQEDREFWRTPVYWLSLHDMIIKTFETGGEEPGWISQHSAISLDSHRVLIAGGRKLDEDGHFFPNHDLYELDLVSRKWTRRGRIDFASTK